MAPHPRRVEDFDTFIKIRQGEDLDLNKETVSEEELDLWRVKDEEKLDPDSKIQSDKEETDPAANNWSFTMWNPGIWITFSKSKKTNLTLLKHSRESLLTSHSF